MARARKVSGARVERRRPSLREEQKLLTRRKLLEAAEALFEEKGYVDATIDDIVERAGASRGTYYLYFKNKSEVIEELTKPFLVEVNALADKLEVMAKEGQMTKQALEAWIAAFFASYSKYSDPVHAWLQAEAAEQTTTEGHMLRLIDAMRHVVTSSQRPTDGRESRADRALALVLLVQLERICYFLLVRNWDFDQDLAISTIADVWYAALHQDQGRRRRA